MIDANKVKVLHPDQVWGDKGCFFVGLVPAKKRRHQGNVVYVDDFGQLVCVVPREAT